MLLQGVHLLLNNVQIITYPFQIPSTLNRSAALLQLPQLPPLVVQHLFQFALDECNFRRPISAVPVAVTPPASRFFRIGDLLLKVRKLAL